MVWVGLYHPSWRLKYLLIRPKRKVYGLVFVDFSDQASVDKFVQQDWTNALPVSKVQPCEWKQYGYWARPFLNNVECPNSPRAASLQMLSKISSSASEVPNHTINIQNYGFQELNTVLFHLVLVVGQHPYLVNLYHFLGKFKSTLYYST